MSLTSPGVSQWTVNESSFGVQTMQTDNNWSVQHGDSFDSCKSNSNGKYLPSACSMEILCTVQCTMYTVQYAALPLTYTLYHCQYIVNIFVVFYLRVYQGSKLSFGKHNRSRSCPSVRCALCKHRHHGGIKMSESMHYTPRVTFQEVKPNSVLGSLPDLRPECACGCPRSQIFVRTASFRHGDSCSSTESILDEAEDFLRESIDGVILHDSDTAHSSGFLAKEAPRRCSENDINKNGTFFLNNNET